MHGAQILTVVQKAIIALIKLTMYLENERMYESKLHLYSPSCLVCKYAYMSNSKYQNVDIYRELRIVMYVLMFILDRNILMYKLPFRWYLFENACISICFRQWFLKQTR